MEEKRVVLKDGRERDKCFLSINLMPLRKLVYIGLKRT